MNSFYTLLIIVIVFLILLIIWFAISSCLGDEIRAHISGRRRERTPTTFGLQYARMMGQSGNSNAGWEQIELQDMMDIADNHRD